MARRSAKPESTLIMLPDAVDLIRFEKNLLQIGFFGSHERRGKKQVSSRRIEQWVNRAGKKIKVSAEFRSSDALGLPSTSDRDKYMGFMKLAMETKLRTDVITNPIRFSGYSLLNVLGKCDSGENYEALNSWGKRMLDALQQAISLIGRFIYAAYRPFGFALRTLCRNLPADCPGAVKSSQTC